MKTKTLTAMLFVPATRPERIDKARASGADAVIVDLEDAVADADKAVAREALDALLETYAGPGLYVRINARGTPWFDEDLELCARHGGVAGILLPKAESADYIARAAQAGKPVLPLIESARGVRALDAIAAAPAVERLSYGGLDLAADLGIEYGTEGAETFVDQCRYQLLVASRARGLPPPIETVFPAFDDAGAVQARARRACTRGFGGMLCIHPRQVAAVHAGFAPDAAQLDWARRVLAGAEAGRGAFKVDGRMVDAPVIAMAQRILQRSSH